MSDPVGSLTPPSTEGGPAPPPVSPGEKTFLVMLFAAIGAVTLVAFALLTVVSALYRTPGGATGALTFFGAGLLAYTFGLRHGVDADHIAAIDNTTRKLLHEGKRPTTVGPWFSLGHSTVVCALAIGSALAASALAGALPVIRQVGTVIGLVISGGFLYLIGAINLVIAIEVYRIFRALRTRRLNEAELEHQLQNRGFMNRYFGRMFRLVETPRQVYPIGVLFGLGFDTASEIFLLALVAVLSVALAPVYVVLLLPLLFTCGMVAVDTADGAAMRYAYGWAFRRPIRKVFYNLTVTVISVLVAFVIGTVELLQVLSHELHLVGPFWTALDRLDFETLGYVVVATFLVAWGVATAYYRHMRLDSAPPWPGTTAVEPPS